MTRWLGARVQDFGPTTNLINMTFFGLKTTPFGLGVDNSFTTVSLVSGRRIHGDGKCFVR